MDLREQTMEYRKLKTINDYIRKSVNPAKLPDTLFEMYSVPIFETGHPEYLLGREIASNKTVVQKNDILLCKINPRINRVWIVADESENPNIASSEWIVVRSSKYNPEFLAWYFRSPRFKNLMTSEVTGIGGSLTRAQPKSVAEYPVPVLEKPEQDAIAIIFNTVDTIIKKRRKQLQKLDELVKARFVEMFGDCVLNTKGWKAKRLGDIAEVGSSKRVFVEDLKESGIPFYRGTEIGALADGKTVTPELFISKEHYAELCIATGAPNIGDLLMPSICPDGCIWVVNTEKPFYFKDGRVLWVHAIDDSYNPVFLLYTLKDRIMSDYSSIASGTTFAELKIFALKECHVFDVPLELQNQFAAFVNQTDKSKVAVQKALDEAQLLFDSLMQKYFG